MAIGDGVHSGYARISGVASTMHTRWEYKVVSFNESAPPKGVGFDLQMQVVLNFHGNDGWELAGQINTETDVFLSFKRPRD